MERTWDCADYRIEYIYQHSRPQQQSDIIDFWERNNALPPDSDAQQRVREVVLVASNGNGEIVGVNTVFTGRFTAGGPLLFFYRQFIQPADRVSGMMRVMLGKAWETLRDCSLQDKPVGVVFVSENPKLMRPGVVALLGRLGWHMTGQTPRQQDIWRKDF